MAEAHSSLRSIMFALVANALIAIAKLVAAIFTGSGSMMAESIHSFADCANQILLIIGLKRSTQPPSMEHPLGHGKEIYFYSFLVSILLFTVGGMFSIYEGVHKIHSTDPISRPMIAICVLIFGIIVEGASLLACLKQIKGLRGDKSLWRWFKETRKSELIVVLGEDYAAMFGLVFALIAVSTSAVTGNPVYDAIGSIVIGVLLLIVAIFIGLEIKALLIGQGVEEDKLAEYKDFINKKEEVLELYNIVTLQNGQNVMVAIKVKMKDFAVQDDLINAINLIEKEMHVLFPEVAWIFFEPDNKI
jgi:cation diffusion facilitator family transporter